MPLNEHVVILGPQGRGIGCPAPAPGKRGHARRALHRDQSRRGATGWTLTPPTPGGRGRKTQAGKERGRLDSRFRGNDDKAWSPLSRG